MSDEVTAFLKKLGYRRAFFKKLPSLCGFLANILGFSTIMTFIYAHLNRSL